MQRSAIRREKGVHFKSDLCLSFFLAGHSDLIEQVVPIGWWYVPTNIIESSIGGRDVTVSVVN